MERRILIVDAGLVTCRQLKRLLERPDRSIDFAQDGSSALEAIVDGHYSLVVTDLQLPGIDGLDLIREIRQRSMPVTVLVTTGFASIESAVEAMKLGAYDYLIKPVDPVRLEHVVERALADRRLQDEVEALRHGLEGRGGGAFHRLVGSSERMRELYDRIARVARTPCTVLITGETGTGKELVAQAVHACDSTRTGSLVAVNCAALPETLLESELFGHERGAFTGADASRRGRFELAGGGTLLLDEIGDLPLGMQAKLLRVLQDGTFERVGGTETQKTSARVLAATNLDLSNAVASGRFRPDLYYRLNVVSIEIPALRSRIDDLALLVEHFLDRLVQRGLPEKKFSKAALSRMIGYDWPGNVRELEHMIELAVLTSTGSTIEPDDLPIDPDPDAEQPFMLDFDLDRPLHDITGELLERIEATYLRKVLEKYKGRVDRCARHSGLSRRSISEKLRRYQIDKRHFKPHLCQHLGVEDRAPVG